MRIRQILASIVLGAGLSACATDPGNGLRYADGSYYAPAGEGRGDYYVGRAYDNVRYLGDPWFDDFYWLHTGGPWYGGWYGSPFYGYGGYCSVRYRYCPVGGWGWADPFPRYDFDLFFGDPWFRYRDGWSGRGGFYDPWRPPSRRGTRSAGPIGPDGAFVGADEPPPATRSRERSADAPDARPPRRERAPMFEDRDDPYSSPRSRRGGFPRRESAPAPAPPPPASSKDGN